MLNCTAWLQGTADPRAAQKLPTDAWHANRIKCALKINVATQKSSERRSEKHAEVAEGEKKKLFTVANDDVLKNKHVTSQQHLILANPDTKRPKTRPKIQTCDTNYIRPDSPYIKNENEQDTEVVQVYTKQQALNAVVTNVM